MGKASKKESKSTDVVIAFLYIAFGESRCDRC